MENRSHHLLAKKVNAGRSFIVQAWKDGGINLDECDMNARDQEREEDTSISSKQAGRQQELAASQQVHRTHDNNSRLVGRGPRARRVQGVCELVCVFYTPNRR